MRLIDKDELKLHKFLKRKPDAKDVKTGSDIYMAGWNDAIETIVDNTPTIDAVEVVRCKDCKFGVYEKGRGICHIRCEILEFLFQDDDFCSYGERREE